MLLSKVRQIVLEECGKGKTVTEGDIAGRLGVSRTPVREVLRHLQEEGLLERKQRKGISLRDISLREMIEIYDLRSSLEGLAGRLLAERIDGKTLAKLRKLAESYQRIIEKKPLVWPQWRDVEIAFHDLIVTQSGNRRLKRLVDSLQLFTISFQIAHQLDLQGVDIRHGRRYTHDLVVAALEKRDPDEAEAAIRNHIQEHKMKVIGLFLGTTANAPAVKKYTPPKL